MKKLCLIHTGGTIAMEKNAAGVLQPAIQTERLLDYVPLVKTIADIESVFLFQLDSSDLNPRHWRIIADTIAERYNDYDGFIVMHGTDTMAYTATALSFMLGDLGKPVVVTGAQLPISAIASDGQNNLINAVRFACENLAEVVIVFGNLLLRGNRAKKMHEFSVNSFASPNLPPLAELGVELRLNKHCQQRHNRPLQLRPEIVTHVAVIKLFPGITNALVLGMVPPRTEGVVIEAYGSGNIPLGPEGIEEALSQIAAEGIVVAIGTQCAYGGVEYERYAGGHFAKTQGALSAHDMTSEAAITKLMWVLGQTKDFHEVKSLYETNIAGELTE